MRTGISLVCSTPIIHMRENYKLMIDGGSCTNTIAKTTLEKMGLDAEPHSHLYNVNWVDKTAQSITQRRQVPIHMSSYEDRVWCDVLNIDAAYILLSRPWLHDLNVTSLGRSNTCEFKFKGKKIALKPTNPKSNVRNNRERTITDKNKTSCYLVIRYHFSPESSIDGFTPRFRNFLSLLPLPLDIPPIVTVEPSTPHLYELNDHNTRQITISDYNYQCTAESHKRLHGLAIIDEVLIAIIDEVLIRVHLERFPLEILKKLHT